MSEIELKEHGKNNGLIGNSYSSVNEAFSDAKLNAKGEDMVFVGGSTFVVAEVL